MICCYLGFFFFFIVIVCNMMPIVALGLNLTQTIDTLAFES